MLESIKKVEYRFKKSFMIGDKLSDERCSRKSNINFFYFNKTYLFQQKKI